MPWLKTALEHLEPARLSLAVLGMPALVDDFYQHDRGVTPHVRAFVPAPDTLDVLPEGERLAVRRTANLHTGGTIHDVTASLHPELAAAAVSASIAIDIPVTGLDMIVPRADGPDGVFIEANERPGLANHEPQPTAERFVDLLFPMTRALPWGWRPEAPSDAVHRA